VCVCACVCVYVSVYVCAEQKCPLDKTCVSVGVHAPSHTYVKIIDEGAALPSIMISTLKLHYTWRCVEMHVQRKEQRNTEREREREREREGFNPYQQAPGP